MNLRQRWEQPLLQDTLTVAVAYGLTTLAFQIWPRHDPYPAPPVILFFVVGLFTASHAFLPAFFYGKFFKGSGGVAVGFVYLHMAFWYGLPSAGLAFMSKGLALSGAVVHILLAPRGTRLWRCISYGSAFFALLLAVLTGVFNKERMWALALVVAYQLLLLRIQSRFASHAFLPPKDPPEKA